MHIKYMGYNYTSQRQLTISRVGNKVEIIYSLLYNANKR